MNFNDGKIYEMKPKDPNFMKRMRNIIISVLIVIFILVLVATSVYTVSDRQQAVVLTFGKVTGLPRDAGIHFKLPFGIQEVELVNVNEIFKEEIGYRTRSDGSTERIANEAKMITGDMNIVNVDFFVEYRISDPVKYLFASQNPDQILKNITQSRIRDVISSYNVDQVLTISKAEIQAKIKELIIAELGIYDIGLMLLDIKIQDSTPPNDDVIAAFKSVETARQNMETAINDARAYKNKNIPAAEAERDQFLRNAEFIKQDRINEANKQVAMFEAMFSQYALNPNIHRQRMYYEAIEQVLPGVKLYINTGANDNVSMVLPLDDFMSNNNNSNNNINNTGE